MTTHRGMKPSACLLLVLLTGSWAWATPKQSGNCFTVATFNVQLMLDNHDDPHLLDESLPSKPEHRIKQIARAIRQLDADVVALQEVENQSIVQTMVEQYLSDMRYRHIVVQPTNSRYGLNLGLISRRPILSITSYRLLKLKMPKGMPYRRFTRDLMQVKLQITDKKTLDLFVVHFKSQRDSTGDPHSKVWRQAEAAATLKIIRQTIQNGSGSDWIIVAGDLNATRKSPILKLLLGGKKPLLIDVHDHLPANERITYLRPPHRSTIDYILASSNLSQHTHIGSAQVLANPKWLGGSDHAPVVATFCSKSFRIQK